MIEAAPCAGTGPQRSPVLPPPRSGCNYRSSGVRLGVVLWGERCAREASGRRPPAQTGRHKGGPLAAARPIVGRQADVEALARWLARAVTGDRPRVFLSGAGGIGKTTVLALWQQQGKRPHAQQFLTEVYSWCTEGFETPDLQEARRWLEVR
jgi:hypothetical protein